MHQCAGMYAIQSHRGFTLFETLVATGILVTALAGIAQLFLLGAQLTRRASASGVALLAAQTKLEELRGLALRFDAAGVAVTDPALQPSPPSTLNGDESPYCDWLDAGGETESDPDAAAFVRRWRITALGVSQPDALAIEVCVFAAPADGRGPQSADACLSTIRTRQP